MALRELKAISADYVSTGLRADELIDNNLSLNGQKFLQKDEHEWPDQPMHVLNMPDNDPEVKKIQAAYAVQIPAEDAIIIKKLFSRYSIFFPLKTTVA